ncbi:MAG: ABC transporter ATP-binding protein [Enterococcus sp.]
MKDILSIKDGMKRVKNGAHEDKILLNTLDLTIHQGDFITVLGGNGAGKSTLFNILAGTLQLTKGAIYFKEQEITQVQEEERAKFLSRVFQDPKMGTAPRMTVAENLALAQRRGQKRRLKKRKVNQQLEYFQSVCSEVGNGLENHLQTPAGELSGGQRQALSLLMATISTPELLLLDEHTAALDPKTAHQLMELTNRRIQEQQLTCLMITHRMEDALKYGNRLLVLQKGEIIADLNEEEKNALSMDDMLHFFEETL